MYTIEYYKTKKEKPAIKEPEYLNYNKSINYLQRKSYLHKKDVIDKCFDIKSLTIDLEDIKHIMQDKNLKHLVGLYTRVNRLNIDESINSITILNNNRINLLYIYEIINCEWMVNYDEEFNNLKLLKMIKKLLILLDQYDKATKRKTKESIQDEIELIKYYMNTIINKYNYTIENTKTLKLGNNFISDK